MTWPAGWGVAAPCWERRGEQLATVDSGGGYQGNQPCGPRLGPPWLMACPEWDTDPAAWDFSEGTCVEDSYSGYPACKRHPLTSGRK